jgi:hypothetical protein
MQRGVVWKSVSADPSATPPAGSGYLNARYRSTVPARWPSCPLVAHAVDTTRWCTVEQVANGAAVCWARGVPGLKTGSLCPGSRMPRTLQCEAWKHVWPARSEPADRLERADAKRVRPRIARAGLAMATAEGRRYAALLPERTLFLHRTQLEVAVGAAEWRVKRPSKQQHD